MKAPKYNVRWSRDELILALYLYCQIPFAKTKANNPEIIRLARLLGRTPSSVARKLGNFGAFDPLLAQRGISGLSHHSKSDKQVWDDFYQKWDSLVLESQQILDDKKAPESSGNIEDQPVISRLSGATEKKATVLERIGQSFFRRSVLSSYEYSCCVCGLDIPDLLIGSHIIPWAVNIEQRTNPQNGLCLCTLHDKSFDRFLITVNSSFEVVVSTSTLISRTEFVRSMISRFHGQKIRMPFRFTPNMDFIEWHFENFQDKQ